MNELFSRSFSSPEQSLRWSGFMPSWTMPNVAKLPYLQDNTIIIQNCGIMVGLMGVAMMLAALVSQ